MTMCETHLEENPYRNPVTTTNNNCYKEIKTKTTDYCFITSVILVKQTKILFENAIQSFY
jgi:hypothetical protein